MKFNFREIKNYFKLKANNVVNLFLNKIASKKQFKILQIEKTGYDEWI